VSLQDLGQTSPGHHRDKQLLEKVQHRFTRMVPGMKVLPYNERLRQLGLWTLEERPNRADLIEMFKMLRGKSCPSYDSMFERSRNLSTRGHSVKLMKHRCTTDLRKYFFSERVIDRWNMLTEDCVSSSTINEFKGKLTGTARWAFLSSMAASGLCSSHHLVWPHQVNDQVNVPSDVLKLSDCGSILYKSKLPIGQHFFKEMVYD